MRNVFLFIRRYFTFLAFLAFQAAALWLLFSYNRFHSDKELVLVNEITGTLYSLYKNVDDFFHLKAENQRLHRMNDSLLNLMPANFLKRDTSSRLVQDSIPYDTLGNYRRYIWRDAKVVYNTVNQQKNYLQLNRGSNQGVRDDMGVINSDGSAVGVVVNVSSNFCQVMSLLHVQTRRSVVLKRTGTLGMVEWDGKDPLHLILRDIPKSDSVAVGDTVVTSINSSFPGFIVGRVARIEEEKSTTYYVIKVRTAANFFNLQQVHIVENLESREQAALLDDTKKIMDNQKNPPR